MLKCAFLQTNPATRDIRSFVSDLTATKELPSESMRRLTMSNANNVTLVLAGASEQEKAIFVSDFPSLSAVQVGNSFYKFKLVEIEAAERLHSLQLPPESAIAICCDADHPNPVSFLRMWLGEIEHQLGEFLQIVLIANAQRNTSGVRYIKQFAASNNLHCLLTQDTVGLSEALTVIATFVQTPRNAR
jgi:hypothetical protein